MGLKIGGKKAELISRIVDQSEDSEFGSVRTQNIFTSVGKAAISSFKAEVASSMEGPKHTPPKSSVPVFYARASDDTSEVSDKLLQQINDLLEMRAAARSAHHFEAADSARKELRSLGVGVDDGSRTWRADWGLSRAAKHGITRLATDTAFLSPSAEAEIHELLVKLSACRSRGAQADLSLAAAARRELRVRFYVVVDASVKTWAVDDATVRDLKSSPSLQGSGSKGGTGGTGGGGAAYRGQAGGRGRVELGERGHDYARSKGDASVANFPLAKLHVVDGLLSARLQAKFRRNFAEADRLQLELVNRLGISLQDDLKEWRADGDVSDWQGRSRGHARDRRREGAGSGIGGIGGGSGGRVGEGRGEAGTPRGRVSSRSGGGGNRGSARGGASRGSSMGNSRNGRSMR
jgi:hypothetical protein